VIFIIMELLRKFIRIIIREAADEKADEELLTEPDEPIDHERDDEASVVASIRGVATPLGTGPTYPNSKGRRKKRKLPTGWQKSNPTD